MLFIKESNWRFCSLLLFLLLFVFIPNFGYSGDMRDELLAAIKNGDENSVNAMIAKGTDVNAADRAGITPLIYAAKNGRTGCVKTLIENGAYINAQCSTQCTPLMWSAANGHTEIVKLLINNDTPLTSFRCSCPLFLL